MRTLHFCLLTALAALPSFAQQTELTVRQCHNLITEKARLSITDSRYRVGMPAGTSYLLQLCHLPEQYFWETRELLTIQARLGPLQQRHDAFTAVQARLESLRHDFQLRQAQANRIQEDFESYSVHLDSLGELQIYQGFCENNHCYELWSQLSCHVGSQTTVVHNNMRDLIQDLGDGELHYLRFMDHLGDGYVDVQLLERLTPEAAAAVSSSEQGPQGEALIRQARAAPLSGDPVMITYRVLARRSFSYISVGRSISIRGAGIAVNCEQDRPVWAYDNWIQRPLDGQPLGDDTAIRFRTDLVPPAHPQHNWLQSLRQRLF